MNALTIVHCTLTGFSKTCLLDLASTMEMEHSPAEPVNWCSAINVTPSIEVPYVGYTRKGSVHVWTRSKGFFVEFDTESCVLTAMGTIQCLGVLLPNIGLPSQKYSLQTIALANKADLSVKYHYIDGVAKNAYPHNVFPLELL